MLAPHGLEPDRMRFRTATIVAVLAILVPNVAPAYKLLAILAHPDAESSIAGLLARYAAEGHRVRVAYTTSGQDGNANTPLPKGEVLALVREGESRCAAKALGIQEPIFLGFVDGDTTSRDTIDAMTVKIRSLIEEETPDVVLTFGPDGKSGHPDNRVTGAAASEVFFQRGLLEHHPHKLYYLVTPESKFPEGPPAFVSKDRPFSRVSEQFVTTVVDGSAYADAIARVVDCNDTQFNAERKRRLKQMLIENMDGEAHLRLAGSDVPALTGKETSVFERLP